MIDEEENSDDTVIDPETGEGVEIIPPTIRDPESAGVNVPRDKVYVKGVDVTILVSRDLAFDKNGKPITQKLTDYTKVIVTEKYATLNEFLTKWNDAEKKEAIIRELEEQGVPVVDLIEAVDKKLDLFDLICHVAYDQPPLTRRERAGNVKKRNYFTKYGDQAREVLEALLEKYADEGVENIESLDVLNVIPFTKFGSRVEIVKGIFGGRQRYEAAVKDLETALYEASAA